MICFTKVKIIIILKKNNKSKFIWVNWTGNFKIKKIFGVNFSVPTSSLKKNIKKLKLSGKVPMEKFLKFKI